MKLSSAGLGQQAPEGENRCLNSELWHACAGPLVSLPTVGSKIVYFPQGHSEQVAASTNREIDTEIPNYPNLPPQLICRLHNVTMHADMETDEVYAQMTLQPLNAQQQKECFLESDLGITSKQPTNYFCKTLTASDTSTHGGFSVPRRAAEKVFPPLDFTQTPPAQELIARDLHDNEWKFRHIFRGQPKRHLLTTGWSVFVSAKRLVAGDSVIFIWNEKNQLLLGIRRANRPQAVMPSSVLSSDSMHIGLLAAAAHANATNTRFTIFYNPRASPSEFVIPLAKYLKAVYHTRVSVGMRFRMLFETEESSVRRYMGTITGISDLDPVRWPNSHWRSVKVGWDESTAGERQHRVSLWEIEPLTTFPMYPSPYPLRLKRPWPPGIASFGVTAAFREDDCGLSGPFLWMRGENGDRALQASALQGFGVNPWLQQRIDASQLGLQQTDVYQTLAAAALQEMRNVDPNKQLLQLKQQQQLLQAQQLQGRWNTPMQDNMFPAHLKMLQQEAQRLQDQQSSQNQLVQQPTASQNHLVQQQASSQNHLVQQQATSQNHLMQQQAASQNSLVQQQMASQNHFLHQQTPSQNHLVPQQPASQNHLVQQQTAGQNHLVQQQTASQNHLVHQQTASQSHLVQQQTTSPHKVVQERLQTGFSDTIQQTPSEQKPCPQPFQANNDVSALRPQQTVSLSSNSASGNVVKTLFGSLSGDENSQYLNLPRSTYPIGQQQMRTMQNDTQFSNQWVQKRMANGVVSCLPNGQVESASLVSQCMVTPSQPLGQYNITTPSRCLQFSSRECPGETEVVQTDPQNHLLFGVNIDSSSSLFVPGAMQNMRGMSNATEQGMPPLNVSNFADPNPNFQVTADPGVATCVDQNGVLPPTETTDQLNPPSSTFIKVYRHGSVGRSLDISKVSSYPELRRELARMFGLEGELEDPRRSGWQLVFVDKENDALLVGDDPWEEFVNNVWFIKILSPMEVQQMSQEGLELLSSIPTNRGTGSVNDDYIGEQESQNLNSAITSAITLDY